MFKLSPPEPAELIRASRPKNVPAAAHALADPSSAPTGSWDLAELAMFALDAIGAPDDVGCGTARRLLREAGYSFPSRVVDDAVWFTQNPAPTPESWARMLDELGAPAGMGRGPARRLLAEHGYRVGAGQMALVVRARKAQIQARRLAPTAA